MAPQEEPPRDCTAEVTRLLNESDGDPDAAAALLPLVYDRLRALAERNLSRERPDQTLQATALVHEAYLRLADPTGKRRWDGRWHFFAAAAEAMRRILVENARRRSRLKRGGNMRRVGLEGALDSTRLTVREPPDELLALDEALGRFAETHPQKAELVKLRYFAGLTMEEVAEALGVSKATAERHWAYARAWLFRRISSGDSPGGAT